VAIVGSGPAGLACAFELARAGHAVTIYEAFHEAGGVLLYGIPEFRLPKRIVAAEIEVLRTMGVQIVANAVVGRLISVDELLAEFDACFIATGAGTPKFMCIEGENLNGVYSANEFLTRINFMRSHSFPEYDTPIRKGQRVAVVGGGNVAMDSVRTALRLGASEGLIVYRRSEEEMPARREEVHHAREEGVRFELLTDIVRIIGSEGLVTGIECVRMGLGEPDAGGRRKPAKIKGSEFRIPADLVLLALGFLGPVQEGLVRDLGVKLDARGNVAADGSHMSSEPGIFVAGDARRGQSLVVWAIREGRDAAQGIDAYLDRI
jgi:glutamate synthase (NADPH/NADH) small chain